MAGWILQATLVLTLSLLAIPAVAGLRDIRPELLPQQPAVQKSYADALSVEEFAREWSSEWRFQQSKKSVTSVLGQSLTELQQALKSAPNNEELLLLTGLVAHYAYNLDIENTYDLVSATLKKAAEIAPDDYRIEWFLGIHQCQSATETAEGIRRILAIENVHSWEQLPYGFWDDYVTCITLANMPMHVVRAGDRIQKLNGQPSSEREFLLQLAKNRLTVTDPKANYPYKDVWSSELAGSTYAFTSSLCGIQFASPGNWGLNFADVEKSICMAQLKTGPHAGKTSKVNPNVLVFVRQPRSGETIEDFENSIFPEVPSKPIAGIDCSFRGCLELERVRPGAYKREGDGHVLVVAFKREEPEYPGILFEKPNPPPQSKAEGPTYFRPNPKLRRMSGVLFYLVVLDTPDSVLGDARDDLKSFLKTLEVE
jgi:hypothetical protein